MAEAAASCRRFPRAARLTQSREFRGVFADARRHGDRQFTILVGQGGAGRPRLGLAVSKRAAPRAVDRNRLKRLIRERFRHHIADLPIVDVVVMVRPVARQCDNSVLIRSLDKLWQRISDSCESS
ncbi:ribonuclease P protein component [Spiribacter vilamensis]|uniref:Ribonuclease P protein component n=1 Tax=Spiribacter vilamensis TaxID=531306 RepID=A0A4Q8D2G2_9GAMM|nr:ribonuclease P protein component [Spiribacter vilamensis]RZU99524.1 ribonuclease P protein component [Spiribacter vilamensis]TVO61505.1 ribonuclease P protein component [Spiribacter vilamensis]